MWKIPWLDLIPKLDCYYCEYGRIDSITNEPIYRCVWFEAVTIREAELQAIAGLKSDEVVVGDLEILSR